MSLQETLRSRPLKRKRGKKGKTSVRRIAPPPPSSQMHKIEIPIKKERESHPKTLHQLEFRPPHQLELKLSQPLEPKAPGQLLPNPPLMLETAYQHNSSTFGWNPVTVNKEASSENESKCATPRGVALAIFERTKWEFWENLGWDLDPSRDGSSSIHGKERSD